MLAAGAALYYVPPWLAQQAAHGVRNALERELRLCDAIAYRPPRKERHKPLVPDWKLEEDAYRRPPENPLSPSPRERLRRFWRRLWR